MAARKIKGIAINFGRLADGIDHVVVYEIDGVLVGKAAANILVKELKLNGRTATVQLYNEETKIKSMLTVNLDKAVIYEVW